MSSDSEPMMPFEYVGDQTPYSFVQKLLRSAADLGTTASVSRCLVGASLSLSFPPQSIEHLYTEGTSTEPSRLGDYKVGDTIFLVEAMPGAGTYASCREVVSRGFLAIVLVPESQVTSVRKGAKHCTPRDVTVESIETFVSQSIEFSSGFQKHKLRSVLRRLLEHYNLDIARYKKATETLVMEPNSV